jgi:hypothetical protein
MEITRRWHSQRGLNSKIHLAIDAMGIPVRIVVTESTTADCTQAKSLITALNAGFCLRIKDTTDGEV